jgi:hypothetical protein
MWPCVKLCGSCQICIESAGNGLSNFQEQRSCKRGEYNCGRIAVAYPGFFRGGSTNSVEDRLQREFGSGGVSPLVRSSTQFANEGLIPNTPLDTPLAYRVTYFYYSTTAVQACNSWFIKKIRFPPDYACQYHAISTRSTKQYRYRKWWKPFVRHEIVGSWNGVRNSADAGDYNLWTRCTTEHVKLSAWRWLHRCRNMCNVQCVTLNP